MTRTYLNKEQVQELVWENRYKPEDPLKKARSWSGIYKSKEGLPALSLPGGDVGELAILIAASERYGFELDLDKATKVLLELTDGKNNLTFQDDEEHPLLQSRYLSFILQNNEDFDLNSAQKQHLHTLLCKLYPSFTTTDLKPQQYSENAVLIIEGEEGVYPQYTFEHYDSTFHGSVLIFQKTFVDRRHLIFAQKLYENKAVELFEGFDSDYLYEIISEMTDTHLYETVKNLDTNLPIFSVKILPGDKITVTAY